MRPDRAADFVLHPIDLAGRGLVVWKVQSSDSLHDDQEGLFERVLYQTRPDRYEYVLTDKGRDFYPVVLAMAAVLIVRPWGLLGRPIR